MGSAPAHQLQRETVRLQNEHKKLAVDRGIATNRTTGRRWTNVCVSAVQLRTRAAYRQSPFLEFILGMAENFLEKMAPAPTGADLSWSLPWQWLKISWKKLAPVLTDSYLSWNLSENS
ncbi:MAG: hypothetical protein JOZ09_16390 [Pseudonocardiales bacterium]|nr:hypothetical protein [Pseudonocardiales bacterium]